MANEVHAPPDEASMGSLLRGIINDVGDLIRQEIRFARTEIKSDASKAIRAALSLAIAAGVSCLGVILVALMLVYLVHWLSLPVGTNPDPATIPLWGCFGIVAAVFLVVGAGLGYLGIKSFQRNNPLPDQTAQSIKENVEWIVNSK
jgi:hypothetical protein